MTVETSTWATKKGLAQMLKGGVIMDVVTPDQARIAEEAGAVAVMALERAPADTRVHGGVPRGGGGGGAGGAPRRYSRPRRRRADERPGADPPNYGGGHDPRHGQGADRA